jgi:hypothetical protein
MDQNGSKDPNVQRAAINPNPQTAVENIKNNIFKIIIKKIPILVTEIPSISIALTPYSPKDDKTTLDLPRIIGMPYAVKSA